MAKPPVKVSVSPQWVKPIFTTLSPKFWRSHLPQRLIRIERAKPVEHANDMRGLSVVVWKDCRFFRGLCGGDLCGSTYCGGGAGLYLPLVIVSVVNFFALFLCCLAYLWTPKFFMVLVAFLFAVLAYGFFCACFGASRPSTQNMTTFHN